MPVLFLELVDGLEVAVEIGARIVPSIAGVVDVLICPKIRKEDLARVWLDVGKRI
jgi:hypothetical protein